jgi:membrane protease YdiL (CAAX protease family)
VLGSFQAYGYGATGAIVSALLFSLAHGVPVLMPFYFGMGMIFAWLCLKTRSLWPPLVLHGVSDNPSPEGDGSGNGL